MTCVIGTFKNKNVKEELISKKNNFDYSKNIAFNKKDIKIAEKENWKLVFLGEIYNFFGLKKKIKYNTDKIEDLVLEFFLKKGIESVKLFDGDFTFFLISDNKIIICRDRHGASYQVFYNKDYFSCFLKDFLNFKNFSAEANLDAIFTFMSIGNIPSPETSLKGVEKLSPGSYLIAENNEIRTRNLFTYNDFKLKKGSLNLSKKDAIKEYKNLHLDSIKKRVRGKKSVGLLLSGGYDSGGNISSLRDFYIGKTYTFSVGFKNNNKTELPLAKIMADEYNTKHFEYEIDGSEIDNLPEMINYMGDPFQESGMMVNYSAMKTIKDSGFTPEIILGGDGNDQHHGTAGRELAWNFTLKKRGLNIFQKMFSKMSNMDFVENDNIFFRLKFHNEKILNILKCDNFGFSKNSLRKLIKKKFSIKEHKYLKNIPNKINNFDELYFAHNFFIDIQQSANEVILFKASQISKMFNYNLTFPYMSTKIYNFLKKLPRELKWKGSLKDIRIGRGTNKFLHKSYLKYKLPSEITERKKQGGFAILPAFFKDKEKREKMKNFILNSDASKELFKKDFLKDFFQKYDKNANSLTYWFWHEQTKAYQFFNFLVISVWWEIFINKKEIHNLNEIL